MPKLTHLVCLVALVAAVAPGLHSQQTEFGPYTFDLKMRFGMYGGDLQQTKFDNKIIGFGLQARREIFGPGHAVAAELTWEHIPSRWNDITDYVTHNQYNTDADWDSKGVLSLHPWFSFDARKEAARGFSLLASYHSKMPSGTGWGALDKVLDDMEWHAGLRFDRYKVYSEFRWLLRNMSDYPEILPAPAPGPGSTLPPKYVGGQSSFHKEGSAILPGAFAGLRQTFSDSFAFELGLRYYGTKHWDFTPGAYFKEPDGSHSKQGRLSEGSSYGYGIEFALVCKL